MGTNNFVALPLIPQGLNEPAESAAIDLYAVVPPNGFSPTGVSVILSGNFTGVIALVGSLDGVNYRPLTEGFNAGAQTDPSRPFVLEFPPQIFTDLIRYVKWKVLPNTKILTDIFITLGGELNCDCSGLGAPGQKFVNIAPIPSGDALENSATPLVTGAIFFNPADYPLNGTTRTIFFRAVAATGNGTVTGHVVLFDATNSVAIKDFAFTSTANVKLEQALTVSVPGANTIANADTKYEVQIHVTAPAIPTDFVELYSAEIRVINTII